MDDGDKAAFAETMRTTLEVYGHDLSAGAIETWWRMLGRYSLEQVQRALHAHLAESVYPPKPADVIGHLQADDGHPDSDEAWEVALQAMDEWASVVWTEEIAQAKSAADPIWAEGDRVGARMAFKKRYDRLVRHARAQGKPAAWGLSPGFDPDQRASALRRAIDMGRLPQEAQAEVEHLEDQRSPEYALEAAKRLSVASDDQ